MTPPPAPAVSVVVPTHDRAHRLADAVASAQAQTLGDIEIIIVDDGSSDGTPEVVAGLVAGDRRIRAIRRPHGEGAPTARNHGVSAARAALVAFLDDDDRWLPAKLERQVAFLDAHSEVPAVGCQFAVVPAGGGAPAEHRGPTRFTYDQLLWANFLGSTSLCLARRDALGRTPFEPSLTNYEDWDLYLRLARGGPLAAVDEVLCLYRDHAEPRLTTALAKRLDGYASLVARHAASMPPDCVAYHRAKLRLLAADRPPAKLVAAAGVLPRSPLVVDRMLVAGAVRGRLGPWRGDPALPLRHLHRTVSRMTPARATG